MRHLAFRFGGAFGVLGFTFAAATPVLAQENADKLPTWRIVNICNADSAVGQCKLYEAVARQRLVSSWTVIPPEWREACLSDFKAPLEPSWRILADCIDGKARSAQDLRARREAEDARAEAARLAETQRVAELAAETEAAEAAELKRKQDAEAAARKAAEAAELKRKQDAEAAARKAAEAAELKRKQDAEEAAREAAEAAELKRKQDAEEAARKAAEAAELKRKQDAEEAARKAAEAAELKRKQDAEEAARKATEAAELKRKQDAEAAARKAAEAAELKRKQDAEEAARKAAEAAELKRKQDAEEAARKAAEAAAAQRKAEAELSAIELACRTTIRAIADRDPFQFRTASARVRQYARAQLDEIAAEAKKCPTVKFLVEGHTDSTGDETANQALSEARAQAIVDHLIGAGVAVDRLTAVGIGEAQPIASNATRASRAKNRRIEFQVQ